MNRSTHAVVALLAAVPVTLRAQEEPDLRAEVRELRARLDELEELQVETSDKVGGRAVLQAFTAASFDLGGHVSSLFTYIDGEADSEAGHMVSLVELFVKAEVDEEWSLFAAPAFYTFNGALLDNPATPTVAGDPVFVPDNDATENLFLSRIYGQWQPSDLLQVQAGVVGSPHGVTNREWFLPGRTIAQANLHTRVLLANQLYPAFLRGARVLGKLTVGAHDWVGYDAYFGVQEDDAADGLGGARLGYTFGELGLTLAANYGRGTRPASTQPMLNFGILQSPFLPEPFLARDYRFGGLDVDWRSSRFAFKGEAYYSAEDGFRDQRALSAEATWFVLPELGLSYRFDFYDAGSDLAPMLAIPAVASRGHSTEHVVGVCYDPHPSVRLRLDLHHNNLPNTDDTVQYANLSWSIGF